MKQSLARLHAGRASGDNNLPRLPSLFSMRFLMGGCAALTAEPVDDLLTPWPELRKEVGFDAYYEQEARYAGKRE